MRLTISTFQNQYCRMKVAIFAVGGVPLAVQYLSDNIVAGQGKSSEPLREREGDVPPPMIAPIDKLGANDAGAIVEIELEIVRFAEVAQRFSDGCGDFSC